MVVSQRLRELALLRTVGATPRQLLRMLAAETGVVALIAGVPGMVLGVLAAGVVAGRFRAKGLVPAQFTVSVNPFILAMALAAGTLIGVLAAFFAAGRAAKIAPSEALRETAVAPPNRVLPRLLAAAALTVGGSCVLMFTPLGGNMGEGMSFISCALFLCAGVAASPLLVRLVSTALTPIANAAGVMGQLASAVVRANTRRVAAVAMPLMLLVGLIATLSLTSTLTTQVAAHQEVTRAAAADADLAPIGSGVPLSAATAIAALNGVRGAAATIPTMVMVDASGKPEHYAAQGVARTGAAPLDLDVRHGNLTALSAGEIAISTDLAAAQHWSVGSQAGIWLADATHINVRVVAIYELSKGFGDVVLPAQLVADHDPRGLVRKIYLAGTPTMAQALAAWPVRAVDTSAALGSSDATTQQVALTAMTAILVGFIGIAVANAFALSITSRRREFGDLRLAGATSRQLHRMVDYETAMSVAIGIGLGCAVSGCVFGVFSIAQSGSWHWVSDPGAYAGLLVGSGLVGLLAGAVPARLVIRRRSLASGDD
jgi:putative ABC transport system permease protein